MACAWNALHPKLGALMEMGSSGSAGELYLSKLEKKLLGAGNRIGAASPVEGLCDAAGD